MSKKPYSKPELREITKEQAVRRYGQRVILELAVGRWAKHFFRPSPMLEKLRKTRSDG